MLHGAITSVSWSRKFMTGRCNALNLKPLHDHDSHSLVGASRSAGLSPSCQHLCTLASAVAVSIAFTLPSAWERCARSNSMSNEKKSGWLVVEGKMTQILRIVSWRINTMIVAAPNQWEKRKTDFGITNSSLSLNYLCVSLGRSENINFNKYYNKISIVCTSVGTMTHHTSEK